MFGSAAGADLRVLLCVPGGRGAELRGSMPMPDVAQPMHSVKLVWRDGYR